MDTEPTDSGTDAVCQPDLCIELAGQLICESISPDVISQYDMQKLVEAMRVIATPINDLIGTDLIDDSLPLTVEGLEAYVKAEFGEDDSFKIIRGAKVARH